MSEEKIYSQAELNEAVAKTLCDMTKVLERQDAAIKRLEALTVEERPQGEWIHVSEKLPERYKEVIVTDIETEDTYCSWYNGNGYWMCDNGVYDNRIIAWQPLPEPYKEGGADMRGEADVKV